MPSQSRAFDPHWKSRNPGHDLKPLAVVFAERLGILALYEMEKSAHQLFRFRDAAPLQHLRHQRRRGNRNSAALALETDIGDSRVRVHHKVDFHFVAAERIMPLGNMVCSRKRPEMARMPGVIQDDVLIQLAQILVHQPNTLRASPTAAISASTSSRVL